MTVRNLRRFKLAPAMRRAFLATARKDEFRLCQFSIQRDHLHLACEADSIDPFSSAWYFDGWSHDRWRRGLDPPDDKPCVVPAQGWLMNEGWRRHGRIGVTEVPAAARKLYPSREEWLGMTE